MTEGVIYSQGIDLNAAEVGEFTPKTEQISECNKIAKILNGGLLVSLQIDKGASIEDIKKAIEKTAQLTSSFKPVKTVPICGECGYKDKKLADKCPNCKSPYII